MSKDKNEELYCICQTSDSGSFMICCDNCEKWFHTNCLGITRSFAKKVKTFYCFICQNKDPELEIEFKDTLKRKRDKSKERNCDSFDKKLSDEDSDFVGADNYPRKKIKSLDDSDDNDDEFRPSGKTGLYDKIKKAKKSTAGAKRGRKKAEEKPNKQFKDDDKYKIKNWRGAGRKPKDFYLKEKNTNKNLKTEKRKYERKEKKDKKEDKERDEKEEQVKQCFGPNCVNSAIKNSKYCSDTCGLTLARKRLIEILPNKIEQWKKIASKSDEINQKQLDKIRQEFAETRLAIEELDRKKKELEKIIAISKEIKPMTEEECNDRECDLDGELSTYCVTCGHEVSYRNASRHMERCFNKFESQTSFSSVFKTKTEGVFCDYYNSHHKTYCKRLKVLCPEHSKDATRSNEDEVCGAPLVDNSLKLTGEYCRWLKKKCTKHYCWEKFRRAEIDMEKVNNWLKLDDLFEKEQKIGFQMASRGGVVSLLLHTTVQNS